MAFSAKSTPIELKMIVIIAIVQFFSSNIYKFSSPFPLQNY